MKKRSLLALAFLLPLASLGEGLTQTRPESILRAEEENVIAAVAGTNNLMAASDWEGITKLNLTGANQGYVQFAKVGTRLFMKFSVVDSTKRTNADKIDFEITTNGKHHGLQGNFDPWLTALGATEFGDSVQTDCAYDDATQTYTYVLGWDLGANMIEGNVVDVVVNYHDAGTDGAWGAGEHSSYSGKLTIPTTKPVVPTLAEVAGTNNLMAASDWEGVTKFNLVGANQGYVQFAKVGTRLFMKFSVVDSTKRSGADKIDFEITTNGKHHGLQGNFDPWLTGLGATEFGDSVQTDCAYDDATQTYTYVLGWDLGANMIAGNEINVVVNYHDAGTDGAWGAGEHSCYTGKLTIPTQETPEPPVVVPNTFVVPEAEGVNGLMTAEGWADVEKYALTGNNEGYVQFTRIGTKLFMKFTVSDDTQRTGKDKIDFEITTNGKHHGLQGNFDPWLTGLGATEFGDNIQTDCITSEAGKYTYVLGWDLGENMVLGNDMNVVLHYHDAGETGNWGDGNASSFEGTLKLGKKPPSYVVPKVEGSAGLMGATNWEEIEKYELTGANEGYVQFAAVGTGFFLKLTVADDTHVSNKDKVNFKIKVNGKEHGQQGNYDPWLTADGSLDLGASIQTEFNYNDTSKEYTMVIGYNLAENYSAGSIVNFTIEHHDAGATGAWGSGDVSSFSHDLWLEAYHVHTYATEWAYNETNHWHAATCDHTSEKSDFAAHAFDNGVATTPATEDKDGVMTYSCACGYQYTEVIPALGHTHTYATEWTSNETDHWHAATCAHTTEISDKANHEFGSWITTENAVSGHNGLKERTCSVCGYKEEQVIQYIEGQVAGPVNNNLNITVKDIVNVPGDADWAAADAYDLIPIYGDSTGATGTIKILTANQNIFWLMEVNDPTICINVDGLYIKLSAVKETEEVLFEGVGNYDCWIAETSNPRSLKPSLFSQTASVTDNKAYLSGVVTYSEGFYFKDEVVPGAKYHLNIRYRDSRNSSESWSTADYKHTIYFDQVITIGEVADKTIRPQTAKGAMAGTVNGISYNKAVLNWTDIDGADSYKYYVYKVDNAGEEKYLFDCIEGPFYAGDETYMEEIVGLSETTAYAIQLVAYDAKEVAISYSEVIEFNTISREEARRQEEESSSTSEEPSPSESEEPSESSSQAESSSQVVSSSTKNDDTGAKKGCGGAAIPSVIGLLSVAGALLISKKRR